MAGRVLASSFLRANFFRAEIILLYLYGFCSWNITKEVDIACFYQSSPKCGVFFKINEAFIMHLLLLVIVHHFYYPIQYFTLCAIYLFVPLYFLSRTKVVCLSVCSRMFVCLFSSLLSVCPSVCPGLFVGLFVCLLVVFVHLCTTWGKLGSSGNKCSIIYWHSKLLIHVT